MSSDVEAPLESDAAEVLAARADAVAGMIDAMESRVAFLRAELKGLANLARSGGVFDLSEVAAAVLDRGQMTGATTQWVQGCTLLEEPRRPGGRVLN